jgi:hypothetical protein
MIVLAGTLLKCAGVVGIGKSCLGLALAFQGRQHHRKYIYTTRMPDIPGMYTMKYPLQPDEKLTHVIVREKVMRHTDPIYFNAKSIMIPFGCGTMIENKICYAFIDHKLHSSFRFVGMGDICWSYDEKDTSVTYMSHHKAVKYFKKKYKQDISLISFLTPMLNITRYTADKELYFVGLNGRDGEFIIKSVGTNLQVVDRIFPLDSDLVIILISLISFVIGWLIVDTFESDYRYMNLETM